MYRNFNSPRFVVRRFFAYNGTSQCYEKYKYPSGVPREKGRHRRYEEARALKQTVHNDNIESLFDRLDDDPFDLPVTEEASLVGVDDDE